MKIDCAACKFEGGMKTAKVPKFSGFIRFIGFIIVIPSVIGILFSILLFFSAGSATSEVMRTTNDQATMAGAAVGGALTFGFSFIVFCSSLVGGLVGWLLLMKSKVFKCVRCGYILPRA